MTPSHLPLTSDARALARVPARLRQLYCKRYCTRRVGERSQAPQAQPERTQPLVRSVTAQRTWALASVSEGEGGSNRQAGRPAEAWAPPPPPSLPKSHPPTQPLQTAPSTPQPIPPFLQPQVAPLAQLVVPPIPATTVAFPILPAPWLPAFLGAPGPDCPSCSSAGAAHLSPSALGATGHPHEVRS